MSVVVEHDSTRCRGINGSTGAWWCAWVHTVDDGGCVPILIDLVMAPGDVSLDEAPE